jgi:hypothetical protein
LEDGTRILEKQDTVWTEILESIEKFGQPNCPACKKGRLQFTGLVKDNPWEPTLMATALKKAAGKHLRNLSKICICQPFPVNLQQADETSRRAKKAINSNLFYSSTNNLVLLISLF